MYLARILVTLKPSVLDIQGGAVERALHSLGYTDVRSARIGKVIELSLDATTEEVARAQIDSMCQQLLANPMLETYSLESLQPLQGADDPHVTATPASAGREA